MCAGLTYVQTECPVNKLAVMWLLLISHLQNGHVSVQYHVNMPAVGVIRT